MNIEHEEKNIKPRMNLFIDMDGVLAKWKYADSEELHRKGYFSSRPAEDKLIEEIKALYNNSEVQVSILSSFLVTSRYAFKEKNDWLDLYLPEIDQKNRHFLPCGMNKAKYLELQLGRELNESDILLDDYSVNLFDFKRAGGRAIKFLNGLNGNNGTWQGEKCDAKSFASIIFEK